MRLADLIAVLIAVVAFPALGRADETARRVQMFERIRCSTRVRSILYAEFIPGVSENATTRFRYIISGSRAIRSAPLLSDDSDLFVASFAAFPLPFAAILGFLTVFGAALLWLSLTFCNAS